MRMVVVPNALSEAINAALEVAIAAVPAAAKDHAVLYDQLLAFYDEHGYLPEFTLAPPVEPS